VLGLERDYDTGVRRARSGARPPVEANVALLQRELDHDSPGTECAQLLVK
jgi:hypothetical protein